MTIRQLCPRMEPIHGWRRWEQDVQGVATDAPPQGITLQLRERAS